jgi:hypothetical protein
MTDLGEMIAEVCEWGTGKVARNPVQTVSTQFAHF